MDGPQGLGPDDTFNVVSSRFVDLWMVQQGDSSSRTLHWADRKDHGQHRQHVHRIVGNKFVWLGKEAWP